MTPHTKDVAILECFSDAALLVHKETATIHYMNAVCCKRLSWEFSNPVSIDLATIFQDLRVMQAILSNNHDEEVTELPNISIAAQCCTPFLCNIKISDFGNGYCCCVLLPIAQLPQHAEYQNMTFSQNVEEFFLRMANHNSRDLLFRYNIITGTIHYFGDHLAHFNLPAVCEHYPQYIFDNNLIHRDDHHAFQQFFSNATNGVEMPITFRIRNQDGQYRWFKKEYILCRDHHNNVVEALGRLTNIQEKKSADALNQQDPLTGCLTKYTFEQLVSRHLEFFPQESHALLIVDLDNFKAVNDNLGHQFGDMVLRQVGETLIHLNHDSDYVGRIGGDEFMVFIKNISDLSAVQAKAQKICQTLSITYRGALHTYSITSSVGIALAPAHGSSFNELYDHADMALYDAKNRGKDGFVFYHQELSRGTMENTLPYDVASRALSQYFDAKLVSEVYNMLFESRHFDISMNTVLQLLGTRFSTSRTYIFELTDDDVYCNTYEWCAQGISSEINSLQAIPPSIVTPFFQLANDEGIYYCNDLSILENPQTREIMENQGIQSFLHAYIAPRNKVTYVFGVDDCCTTRIWSPVEISTILHVSKIIVQFLNHYKTLCSVKSILDERVSVLDALNFNTYIVDIDTHELIYYNQTMANALPEIKLSAHCYKVIRGNDKPCANCPVEQIRHGSQKSIRTLAYNQKLDANMLINATRLASFDGKASVFMTSIDVTDLTELADIPSGCSD